MKCFRSFKYFRSIMIFTDKMSVHWLLFLCLPHLSLQYQKFQKNKYDAQNNAKTAPVRLIKVMKQTATEARLRVLEMNEMRFMYEESPHYEFGYLTGELVERYRKMVNHVKRPIEYQSDSLFPTLKRTELIQRLYFEIFHLVNMMHEIARKYAYIEEFAPPTADTEFLNLLIQAEKEKETEEKAKKERNQKKKDRKLREKMRQLAMEMGQKYMVEYNRTNILWPLDYGWELPDWTW